MKYTITTGLNRKLVADFINKTKKKLRIEILCRIVGNKFNTQEFVYVQIYNEFGHLVYNKKLKWYGEKLVETI